MKTITKTYNVFSYDELDEKAKERVVGDFYDINVNYAWYEYVWEDAGLIGLIFDDMDIYHHARGHFRKSPLEVIEAILENHGKDCETYKTATTYKNLFEALPTDEDGDIIEDDDLENDFKNCLLEDYRVMLRKEYEYLTSEEAIIKTINLNEYEFLADGSLFSY